ncbi:alpha/beta-hydrolase [Rhodofomes roseus]|uniref:Alpha/beta-hydrolase n=1 Tax=Rhodofomes roseus TaxID=34475 RepID=A0ABQ8KJG5_9APHY|nr:alpha/beta-hydrolase [Rhodofomes roseus]KAH9838237.1 alpha/beta-hydrolase [Rhodofomes roseus]
MPAQQKVLTSPDGTEIWGEEAGDRTKPTIVFIHGLACTAIAFNAQFNDPELLKNVHLVRYEMRGHGRSGMPESLAAYRALRHAEDFRTVCEAFGVVRPIVLGWSLGGCIPGDVVRYYGPDYIAGIVYNGGAVLSLQLSKECRHPAFLPLIPLICSPDAQVAAKSAVPFVDSCFADPASLSFETKMALVGGFAMQPPIIRHYSLTREQEDRVWRESARRIPVLIVQGMEDTHCLYERMIEQAKEIYDEVEVKLLQGVGHAPQAEAPEETNQYLLEFMRRVSK